MGDFHYAGSKGAYDYTYDGNGNLNLNNKSIDKITYNYLNLPQLVHLNTKGNITYTYDAAGNKPKVTADSTVKHSTTTLYVGPFVYQQSDTLRTQLVALIPYSLSLTKKAEQGGHITNTLQALTSTI